MARRTNYSLLSNKVRLYPNQEQEQALRNHAGTRRWIYNRFLAIQVQTWEAYKAWEAKPANRRSRTPPKKRFSYNETSKILTAIRDSEEFGWLSETPRHTQQQVLIDLDAAFSRFFSGTGKHPKFKRKGAGDSFRTDQSLDIDLIGSRIKSVKLGWLRCRGIRPELEHRLTIQSITISLEAGKWYASILCRMPAQETPEHEHPNRACGVDVGIAIPYTVSSSTGKDFCYGAEFSKALAKKEAKRKRYQRSMKRKLEAYRKAKKTDPEAKLSNNFKKASAKVARAYQRETNFKLDFQHKLTTKLVTSYGVICVEDLKIRNMTRSAKGTEKVPGKNVKQKQGLNRELLRLAHSRFVGMLEYKAKKHGSQIVRVDPKNTSRECPCCGHVDKRNRKSQAVFECIECGYSANADTNAAFNILCRGTQALLVA